MQTGYGNKCVDVIAARPLVRRLNKNTLEEQVCVTKQGPVRQDGIQKLVQHWQKCNEVGGYYVEM